MSEYNFERIPSIVKAVFLLGYADGLLDGQGMAEHAAADEVGKIADIVGGTLTNEELAVVQRILETLNEEKPEEGDDDVS